MKTFIVASGLLVIAAAVVLIVLRLTSGYPVDRTLVSSDGRTIDVTIVGKRGNVIVFERFDDGSRWDLPIHQLSLKDRMFVMLLPEQDPPPRPAPAAPPKPVDPYIANRRAIIQELEKKRAIILSELASRTLSETMERRRREELSATEKEIRQLDLSIKSYRYRTKQD